MKTNELQLVSFEQARKLKRMGFDWECDHLYNGELLVRTDCFFDRKDLDIKLYSNWNDAGYDWNDGVEKEWTSAPTVTLALKWFRDTKNLTCWIDRNATGYYFGISKVDNGTTIYLSYEEKELEFETYEQAESALLDELLKLK
ncbi:MAG: hypothetical protein BGO29_14895 [Bacteroidales bacterium 36-12]|nr:MAG: hypothetical protein BGO29_14895 [Bacteroidales bacterium 36-12]